MTEKEKALTTSARKSIGMHKLTYIFYSDKIYRVLFKRFQSICEGCASTGIDHKTFCHYVEKLRKWNLIVSATGRCPVCGRIEELITTNKNITEPLQQSEEYYRPRKLGDIMNGMFNPGCPSTPTKAKKANYER
jgi:hypothetical protein